MLVLWDIDGTLTRSFGAGRRAMEAAGRDLFGDEFTLGEIEMSGWTDLMIWREVVRINGIDAEELPSFRRLYEKRLRNEFESRARPALMPGVRDLHERLGGVDGLVQGLLTGNFPETGRMKIAYAGLDPDRFVVCAWGHDADSRRELVPIAIDRHHATTGERIEPERVVIIGDTPRDVDCARHNGCRSIAVATVTFSIEELRDARPDLAVESLEDGERIVEFILERAETLEEAR